MHKPTPGWPAEHRFAVLLTALLFAVLGPALAPAKAVWWVLTLTLIFALIAGQVAVARSRRSLLIGWAVLGVAVLLSALARARSSDELRTAALACAAAFLLHVVVGTLRHVLRAKRVTSEILCAAVSAYLLFGYLCGLLYHAMYLGQPGAFSGPIGVADAQASFTYFSFVTQTTLGYGDLVPSSDAARALAVFQALVGQLYVVILIARLVALQIMHASKEDA